MKPLEPSEDLGLQREYPEDIDFQKYWLILKRHWLPATAAFVLTVLGAAAYTTTIKPVYEAQAKLLLKKQNAASGLVSGTGETIGQAESLGKDNTLLDTEAEVIRSLPIAQKTITTFNIRDQKGQPLDPEKFLKQVQAKAIRGTDILLISYKNNDPNEAAKVVNQLISIYLDENIRANRAEATAAREFISEQLPKTETSLRLLESSLRSFREKNNIVNLEEEARSAVATIADLNNQLSKAKVELDAVTTQAQKIQTDVGMTPEEGIAVNSLSQSPAVQQALEKLQEVQAQLAIQQARFQDTAPTITKLQETQDNLQKLLQERITRVLDNRAEMPERNFQIGEFQQGLITNLVNLEAQRLSLLAQVSQLSQIRSAYIQRANLLPGLEQRQKDIERQLNAAQSTYEALLKNLQQVQIVENQNVGNARIVSSAIVPQNPMGSSKKLVLIGGVIVGSLLYIVVAFLAELRDPSIKTIKEIRQLLGYPLLRMIPLANSKSLFDMFNRSPNLPILPVRDAPYSITSEAYKMLQANLRLLYQGQGLKTIAVTSAISQEGRSTVAANLALALAQLGHRVILVEADLRHPVQHLIWKLDNQIGLGDVVMNPSKLSHALIPVSKNLDILPSGSIADDPLTLIDSKTMSNVIQEVRDMYDFVILDTPPLLLAADAVSLTKISDGILLVIRPGTIDKTSATATKELLAQTGQAVLGLVVNGVKTTDELASYSYHSKRYQKADLKYSRSIELADRDRIETPLRLDKASQERLS